MLHSEGITFTKAKRTKALAKKFGRVLRISRWKFSIIYCDTLFQNGSELRGLHDPINFRIYVIDDKDIVSTLIHEIIHAVMDGMGMGQAASWSQDLEEMICETISQDIAANYSLTPLR
jgi:hypothetical protein